jgi:DNA-binding transcriptional LysR family regulator
MLQDRRIVRRLKLRDLHTLLVVAERKSMAKAADDLGLTQPAVSKVIADMERTLGVPLLDRTSRGIDPTPYGRTLLKWSDVLLDDLRRAVEEVRSLADPGTAELRIGASQAMLAGAASGHRQEAFETASAHEFSNHLSPPYRGPLP